MRKYVRRRRRALFIITAGAAVMAALPLSPGADVAALRTAL